MKKTFALLAAGLLVAATLGAQTAESISEILAKESATYLDFSYLIASELGMEATPFEAYTWCERFGTYPAAHRPNTPIPVKSVSHFFMANYGLKGGLMWSATNSPRYAWKELKSEGFWPQGTDPDQEMSGKELLRAVSSFFNTWPDAKLREPDTAAADQENRKKLLSTMEEPK